MPYVPPTNEELLIHGEELATPYVCGLGGEEARQDLNAIIFDICDREITPREISKYPFLYAVMREW